MRVLPLKGGLILDVTATLSSVIKTFRARSFVNILE